LGAAGVKVRLWGTRGSLAAPGPDTVRYGGNTACVEVTASDGTRLLLDGGTGIRRAGQMMEAGPRRVDVLLTHLHMDHIQGLGFFSPLRRPGWEVHLYGPGSATQGLRARLTRYLSPPTFPVLLRELACDLRLHEVACGDFDVGPLHISSSLICHPNHAVGYRIQEGDCVLAYLPDHEPALGVPRFPLAGEWTSGYRLAADADLLIHDAQYSRAEYAERVGFGHSSIQQSIQFAGLAGVKQLVPFHHDPGHSDEQLDQLMAEAIAETRPSFSVTPGMEGTVFEP
jgi:ribonuclease BN (tRNA processing enzyme)